MSRWKFSVRSLVIGATILIIASSVIIFLYHSYMTFENGVVISKIGRSDDRFVIRGNFPRSNLVVRVELDNVVYGELLLRAQESHTCYFELKSVGKDFHNKDFRFELSDWKDEFVHSFRIDETINRKSSMANTLYRSQFETEVYHTVLLKEFYHHNTLKQTLRVVIDKVN